MARRGRISAARRAAVFTLKREGVAGGWLRRVFLWQSHDKTLERQNPRQKTRKPSAGKDPLTWSKLCHPTMTGREYGKSMATMPARPDFSKLWPNGTDRSSTFV